MKWLSLRSLPSALAGAALVAACVSFDGLQPSARPRNAAALPLQGSVAAVASSAGGWPSRDWWKAYGDPQLNALIGEALASSPTLALARARIEQADALASAVDAGLETKVELHQAVSAVFEARADVVATRERIALLGHELAALAGQGPDRGLRLSRPRLNLGPAAALPVRLPAELLGRRPDIVAQRLRVESASSDIAAARAGFYPNINLNALLGFQSVGLDQLLRSGSRVAGAAVAVSLPIFDGGRLRSNLAGRNADYDLAVEQYNGTLVEALRDVADQVNSWHAIDLQRSEQSRAQTEVEEAYRLATLRYQGGLSSYLSVLSVESQMLAQQRLADALRARRLTASIGLARALGGGFQGDSPSAREAH